MIKHTSHNDKSGMYLCTDCLGEWEWANVERPWFCPFCGAGKPDKHKGYVCGWCGEKAKNLLGKAVDGECKKSPTEIGFHAFEQCTCGGVCPFVQAKKARKQQGSDFSSETSLIPPAAKRRRSE